jgi:hypothetical protein
MVQFQDPNRFLDKNRYQSRRIFNKIVSFIWSVIVFVAVAAIVAVVAYICAPWMKNLWETISGRGG